MHNASEQWLTVEGKTPQPFQEFAYELFKGRVSEQLGQSHSLQKNK